MNRTRAGRSGPPLRLTVGLVVLLLLAINGLAIGTLMTARSRALEGARDEIRRRTADQARRLETALGSARGELLFLSRSPSFLRLASLDPEDPDPTRRRWTRLDAEGGALLFLRSHPEIERLLVATADGRPMLAAGRRGGAPIVLPPELASAASEAGVARRRVRIPDPAGRDPRVAVELAVDRLRESVLPEAEGLEIRTAPDSVAGSGPAADPTARSPIEDDGWDPPIAWTLVSREDPEAALGSVVHLAENYRNTVIINVVLIALTTLLGAMAFREVRRAARLEAERQQEERVHELEQGLVRSDRLASLGRLAAGIAHEINNPLEGISNYLRLLEEDLESGDAPEARRHRDAVEKGFERVASIVRQTLRFADPGREEHEELDLSTVVERAVEFVRDSPRAGGVEIEMRGAPGSVPVRGNATTLGQLVLNLVVNACEAQPGGGRVEVEVREDGDRAVVTVDDRGAGIPEEALERVFEPFFSGKGSTGLGLSVSYRIAEDHGGRLRAENRPEGGARFRLEIPRNGVRRPEGGER